MTSTIAKRIDINTQENLFVKSSFPRFCLQGMKHVTCVPKHYNCHLLLKQGHWQHERHRCVSFWLGATLWRWWVQAMVCNQQMVRLAAVISEWHWRLTCILTFLLDRSLTIAWPCLLHTDSLSHSCLEDLRQQGQVGFFLFWIGKQKKQKKIVFWNSVYWTSALRQAGGSKSIFFRVNMSHSQMLGKVESGGGPIFKVVLEC